MSAPARIHLVIGPVGAGKSTFARQLARELAAIHLNLDAWMARLYGAEERPPDGVIEWYVVRRDRCIEQIWCTAEEVLGAGANVILEIGMLQRRERRALYARVDGAGWDTTVYVLDAPRDVRRARVERRNVDRGETFAMAVPPHIFELASDMWEPPDDDERAARVVRDVVDVPGDGGSVTWLYES